MRRLLLPVLTGALVLLVTAVSTGFAGRDRYGDPGAQRVEPRRDRAGTGARRVLRARQLDHPADRPQPGLRPVLRTVRRPGRAPPAGRDDGGAGERGAGLSGAALSGPDRGSLLHRRVREGERTYRARWVRAGAADLSPDESKNPFFAPSFALDQGRVYQAKPYVSPDTDDWVIANSTLVPMADGSKPAIVHFEVTMDSFRREAVARSHQTVMVVDADTGAVLINSTRSG